MMARDFPSRVSNRPASHNDLVDRSAMPSEGDASRYRLQYVGV